MAHSFVEIKRNNYEQYGILLNYVLPEYEKICLENYLNKKIEGKLVLADEQDERLTAYINEIVHVWVTQK